MVSVAILGFGVVGSGVAEVIDKNAKTISDKAKNDIAVKYILDVRDFPDSPYSDKIIHDFSIIENDPEVKIVVETIGGKTVAYDFTKRALLAGKNVVTSNKELVAEHGVELIKIARERNLNYLFEASVGGGIPIIRPLTQCLSANNLNEICGILNGTTNYILTKMIKDRVSFADALSEAQQKGYAEKDPTADIEGFDACRKICILADLAYGKHISPSQVKTEGITKISLRDVECAKAYDCVIKLIGRVVKKNDDQINILVAPHLVPNESPLSNVEDVFNGIMVDGDAIGNVMFYGRGAGKLPTASAVVADVIDVVKHFDARKYIGWDDAVDGFVADSDEMEYKFMVRVSGSCKQDVEKLFPGAEMLSKPDDEDCAFVTACEKTKDIYCKLDKLKDTGYNILSAIRIL